MMFKASLASSHNYPSQQSLKLRTSSSCCLASPSLSVPLELLGARPPPPHLPSAFQTQEHTHTQASSRLTRSIPPPSVQQCHPVSCPPYNVFIFYITIVDGVFILSICSYLFFFSASPQPPPPLHSLGLLDFY